jgi:outer membrane lipoprotein-sorting protein
MGKMLEGFDGKNGWSYSSMQGPAVKTGNEALEAKANSDFREEEWRARYSKAETIGIEMVEGEECYKVALTPKTGNLMTNFYSKKSGLLIKTAAKVVTAMGEIEGQITYKDYRKIGGLLMPYQVVNNALGQSMTMTFSEIKINADIPKSTFEPPAEVKALISK